jgi:hypothetical protein
MSFVDHYLPYFGQRLITHPLSSVLPFQPLFTESSCRDQLLALSLSFGALIAPHPLYCMFVFNSLFIVQLVFFVGWVSVCPGSYAGLSQGWLWEYHMTLGAHLLVCWMSPKQVWSLRLAVQEPSCFLSVMWHGEALYGLEVQGVEVLILLGASFLPSVAPSVSARFLIYGAHAVCFCLLLHSSPILDPPNQPFISLP